jgi:cbb3-type cytochrome oxidase subunit 3
MWRVFLLVVFTLPGLGFLSSASSVGALPGVKCRVSSVKIVTMTMTLHAEIRAFIFKLLSRQKVLTRLPEHGYQIFLAFLMFTATSWLTYYFIAPSLIRYSKKKKAKSDEQARLKWGHMAVSFLHAVIASSWSFYLWYDNSLAHSLEDRVSGYSRDFGMMFSFSVGYFLWDVFCCAWYLKHYGKGFFVHSLLGLLGLSCCYKPFMMYPSSRFLLFEVSTIFVDMHWFLEKVWPYKISKLFSLDSVDHSSYCSMMHVGF